MWGEKQTTYRSAEGEKDVWFECLRNSCISQM